MNELILDDDLSLLAPVRERVVPGAHVRVFSRSGQFKEHSLKTGWSIIQKWVQVLLGVLRRRQAGEEPESERDILVARTRLYNPLPRSVRRSVRRSIGGNI